MTRRIYACVLKKEGRYGIEKLVAEGWRVHSEDDQATYLVREVKK